MESDIDQLVEMGWTKEFAEKALDESKHQGVQAALEWIMDHPNIQDEKVQVVEGDSGKSACQSPLDSSLNNHRFYKCDICGKHLNSMEEMQMHSAHTGHSDYKESDEPPTRPTAEEKQAEILRLQERLKLRKFQNEEADRQKNIEDEKHRRQQGKALLSAKAKFQEEEMRRNAEQLRKERAEDKAYREKLRAEIARDRENRAIQQSPKLPVLPTTVPQTLLTSPKSTTPLDVTECRLQIRTPTGQPLKCTFQSTDNLGAVVQFVGRNWPMDSSGVSHTAVDCQEITLQTTFPTRKFCIDDFPKTLEQLGLCPSAVLMAQRRALP